MTNKILLQSLKTKENKTKEKKFFIITVLLYQEVRGIDGFCLVARPPPPPPPQRFSCEHSTSCNSSRIIFKFGMEVRYGNIF